MALWKVFPGEGFRYESDFLEHGHVGINFGFPQDLRQVDSEEELKQEHDNQPSALWRFYKELRPGALVAVPFSKHRIYIAEIAGEYEFRADDPYHLRPVNWLAVDMPDADFGDDLIDSIRSPSTFHRVNVDGAEERVRELSWTGIDEYLGRAQPYFESVQLDEQELRYKREIISGLERAREAARRGDRQWSGLVQDALTVQGSPLDWRRGQPLYEWFRKEPDASLAAMREFWSRDARSVGARIRALVDQIPESETFKKTQVGTTLRAVSALLMALGADHPPYTWSSFDKAYQTARYPRPRSSADHSETYEHALRFLDRLVERAPALDLQRPADRLEAQSLVWILYQNSTAESNGPGPDNSVNPDLDALADELLLDFEFLQTFRRLLEDKRQVILQGPPGTGKTYVARKLAQHLAGSEARVRLAQFHPSYAYEDFVQGYRPTLDGDGRASFELRDGPLLEIAKLATDDPGNAYFLVIDEINRGNLAKVFGELYFLLEYRDQPIRLQYSNQPFSLPDNLRIIGTMNTADRSIALVDLALRRRFYFVEFHPDREPIQGLLGRWLDRHAPDMAWVADVVGEANRKLDNRDAAIGPSYFMREALDEEQLNLVWQHNVLPYIEEQLYGEPDRLGEFSIQALRAAVSSSDPAERQGDEPGQRDAHD